MKSACLGRWVLNVRGLAGLLHAINMCFRIGMALIAADITSTHNIRCHPYAHCIAWHKHPQAIYGSKASLLAKFSVTTINRTIAPTCKAVRAAHAANGRQGRVLLAAIAAASANWHATQPVGLLLLGIIVTPTDPILVLLKEWVVKEMIVQRVLQKNGGSVTTPTMEGGRARTHTQACMTGQMLQGVADGMPLSCLTCLDLKHTPGMLHAPAGAVGQPPELRARCCRVSAWHCCRYGYRLVAAIHRHCCCRKREERRPGPSHACPSRTGFLPWQRRVAALGGLGQGSKAVRPLNATRQSRNAQASGQITAAAHLLCCCVR